MIDRIRKHHASFKNAVQGIIWVIKNQNNFQVHLLLSIFAVILGLLLNISAIEMLIIIGAIFLGLVAEMLNTSLEAMTDLITLEWRKEAKIAKDVSAGMVLLVAIGTFVIGIYIFLPKLFGLL